MQIRLVKPHFDLIFLLQQKRNPVITVKLRFYCVD